MEVSDTVVVTTTTPEATRALGRWLGERAQAGQIILLLGPLGAGKTCLAQGVGEGLGVRASVRSPSFTLVNEYEGRVPFYHLDLYRLDPGELGELGLEEYLEAPAVVVVEWGERAEGLCPDDRLELTLTPDPAHPQRRYIELRAWGAQSRSLMAELERTL